MSKKISIHFWSLFDMYDEGQPTSSQVKEENKNRKYFLMEMGTYFNIVTKPRIQKVIYSDNWKNGKPLDNNGT
ncbi:hypothetical protein LCGC14_2719250, partial [marine sediment metagenome]